MADIWVPTWIPNKCDGFLLRMTCPSVVPRALNFDPLLVVVASDLRGVSKPFGSQRVQKSPLGQVQST